MPDCTIAFRRVCRENLSKYEDPGPASGAEVIVDDNVYAVPLWGAWGIAALIVYRVVRRRLGCVSALPKGACEYPCRATLCGRVACR